MRKVVPVLLVIFLVLVLPLGGCSSGEGEAPGSGTEDPTATPDSPEPEAPAEEEPGTLTTGDLAELFRRGGQLNELSYTMVYRGTGMDEMETRIWMKEGRMRTEADMGGMKSVMIMDGDNVWMLDEAARTAIRFPADGNPMEAEGYTLEDFTSEVEETTFNQVGEETINGVPCYVVETTQEGSVIRMWLHKETGFVMKVEGTGDGGDYVMEIRDFQAGGVDDSLFEVPGDYEITDFGNLEIPGMPAMP